MPTLVVAERGVVPRDELEVLSGSASAPRDAVRLRSLDIARAIHDEHRANIERAVAALHEAQPLVRGFPRDDVRARAGVSDQRLFNEIVEAMGDVVVADGPLLRSAEHEVVLNVEQNAARDVLLGQMSDAGSTPPSMRDLIDTHGEPLVRALLDDGTLVRIIDDMVFTAAWLEDAKRTIAELIERDGPQTTAALKAALGTSRKYAVPLLEFLDGTGFTRREGDRRVLAGR